MKALVKFAHEDGALEVRDAAVPEPVPGTVRVRVHTVGVCGSDIHMWHDSQSKSSKGVLPVTLGHESAGIVEAVGEGVEGWAVGDRVVCETAASICGVCALCRSGRYNLCPWREGYGLKRDGAMAEYVIAEPRVLHRIPDGVSFEEAAMTEPFSVAYNAVIERAGVKPGDLVVIQGAGAIGILALQIAQLARSRDHRRARHRHRRAPAGEGPRAGRRPHRERVARGPGGVDRHPARRPGRRPRRRRHRCERRAPDEHGAGAPGRRDRQGRLGSAAARIHPRPAGQEGRHPLRLLLAHLAHLGERAPPVLGEEAAARPRARRRLPDRASGRRRSAPCSAATT